mmetsp:Transcript_84980/g.134234  ORF Transcript_84980/g.134234 Transcript_84980/m.134234 type:complete len:488 (-) Transcript_84980:72-1535(-)
MSSDDDIDEPEVSRPYATTASRCTSGHVRLSLESDHGYDSVHPEAADLIVQEQIKGPTNGHTSINAPSSFRQRMIDQHRRLQSRNNVVPNSMVVATGNPTLVDAATRGDVSTLRLNSVSVQSQGQPSRNIPRAWNMDSQLETRTQQSRIPDSIFNLDTTLGMISLADAENGNSVVAPEVRMDSDEEEARRRTNLAQELDERGICPVYDPTPQPLPEVAVDMSNIAPGDMKTFLLCPAPKASGMIECRITRKRGGVNRMFPSYTLESDSGVFLLSAKKRKHNKTSNYSLSMSRVEDGNESDSYLGKLRSNFFGLEFTSYGTGLNPSKIDSSIPEAHAIQLARQELVAVQYSSSLWGSKPRGPRKMCAIIPRVRPNGERTICRTMQPAKDGLLALQKADPADQLIECYHNKPPKWNDQIGAFVLNFNKRVTQASVKNFQLTHSEDPDTVYLQFGRVGKDVFNMDFRHPFSPFQAFAICLSSFDYKLCCE